MVLVAIITIIIIVIIAIAGDTVCPLCRAFVTLSVPARPHNQPTNSPTYHRSSQ